MSGKYAKAVARGVALLDAEEPDWRDKVDCETLDLGDCEQCVLGQVFGGYETGLEVLDLGMAETIDVGFDVDEHSSYRWLGKAWKRAIGCV